MKSVKKPVFFIVAALILALTVLTIGGVHTAYGDVVTSWVRGLDDIRWGIDIRGGVDVTFTPPSDVDATDQQVDAARSVIETRLMANNITDYEIYPDYNSDRIIVRFPWQSDDEDFDPEAAVKELGETALLTFREGQANVGNGDPESLPLVLSGADVESANAYYDDKDSEFAVSLKLKDSGKEAFSEATGRLAGNGYISIWLDEYCFSSPSVNAKISDGSATISGNFTREEVIALADKINGGALPYKLVTDSFSTISPTLGEGAKEAMGIAAVAAFLLVSIFMVILYRVPGIIAVFGLLGQAIGSLAVVTGFFWFNNSFTLTIPGIAGIILSIGMGVDANVITGERIKEELRAGKTLDGALQAGYKRAFTAIFDGNVTLIIIAIVLMGAFGTPDSWASIALQWLFFMFGPSTAGTIYSFGFTLGVGAVLNFVFGVFTSRLMTYSIAKFQFFRKPTWFGGPKGGAVNA
ncbi:MAG: MMPL family transporter [Oscillospiraceae bacterium]|nr:MMPL family transporter [Oscillospiraceae bacterium]